MRPGDPRGRPRSEACATCGGRVDLLRPCQACSGTGVGRVRCRECHSWQEVGEFLRAGRLVKICRSCRARLGDPRLPAVPRQERILAPGPLRFTFSPRSSNRKTGPIPVTMTSARTCPAGCPWRGRGCYAEQDFVGVHWRRLEAGGGLDHEGLCERVAGLASGQIWRHNEAGDLPGDGDVVDALLWRRLCGAAAGTRGFTYTHKPVLGQGEVASRNREILAGTRGFGITVNLSADGLAQADELADLDVAPVVVVVPAGSPRSTRTPAGRRVATCPATYRDDVSCMTCELCCRDFRGRAVVAFPAHGAMAGRMSRELVQLRLL